MLKAEADYYLNKSYTSEKQHKKNLKEAQKRYDKIIELNLNALFWNEDGKNNTNSDIQKEFFLSMEKYIELKLQYYTLNKDAINLELQGKTKQAQNKYKEAQKLLLQIKAQEKVITISLQKDPELQKEIATIKQRAIKFTKYEQENGELLKTDVPTKIPES
jgi:23S rRNA pseudoU1915 N3-methylase RlmH